MSHNRYMSWSSDVLTMPPAYPPSGPVVEYPSPVSRRPSDCLSEMSIPGSRRGSSAGFVAEMENKGHWQSLGSESNSKSPLASFGFFKNLSEKKTTRDGQTPKRRGPKPDSKPALTRRQELNRQAQRTHRERKEMYIKALEQEVIRLKEAFSNATKERDAFAEENRRLKDLLMAHGISFDISSPGHNGLQILNGSGYGGSSSGSVSGGYGAGSNSTGYTSPPTMSQHRGSVSGPHAFSPQSGHQSNMQSNLGQHPNGGMDYDQIGVDFVLALENPCMDHMQYLVVRAHDGDDEAISGHALMASCPPESHIINKPKETYPNQMPDIAPADIMKMLYGTAQRLGLSGEITPIMAWKMVLQDERFPQLTKSDFESLKKELLDKVRCYGFGAVLEEFEVQDALMNVIGAKDFENIDLTGLNEEMDVKMI